MALKVGDKVRLYKEGESYVLDGMFGIVGAEELYGTELTVTRVAEGEYAQAFAAPLPGFEELGEFPLDEHTTPDATEALAA